MRRALLVLALALCALVEFSVYPGHSFLQTQTQVLVPMLERLQFPGLLSRDLVAMHPVLRYTAYDELTLALTSVAHLTLEQSLLLQLFASRLAAMAGVYWIARACKLQRGPALPVAAVVNLGAFLPGIEAFTSPDDLSPQAIALGWAVLALGLGVRERVAAAALAAGFSLLYSPAIAFAVWLSLLITALRAKGEKLAMRTLLTTLFICALLLANLAQLQPGAPGGHSFFAFTPAHWKTLIAARTPSALAATWIGREGWLIAAIPVASLCALYRLRHLLGRPSRVLLASVLLLGLASMPLEALLQQGTSRELFIQLELTRALLPATVAGLALLGVAALTEFRARRWRFGAVWSLACLVLLALPLSRYWRKQGQSSLYSHAGIESLSDWAGRSTWGGSMFLFTGLGKRPDAGVFRVLALRPSYVDWPSGELTRYYQDFAEEWSLRWTSVSSQPDSAGQIRATLSDSIDYYVVPQRDRLPGVPPVFTTRELLVYDARDLRAPGSRFKRLN